MARTRPDEQEGGTATATRSEKKLKRPRLFWVLFHNYNYTTREFVVYVLQTVFFHDEAAATRIMWHVHLNGMGVAGVFTYEIAETKRSKVEELAKQHEFPLRVTVEPEDDEEGGSKD